MGHGHRGRAVETVGSDRTVVALRSGEANRGEAGMIGRAVCRACGWFDFVDGELPQICGNAQCGAPFVFYVRGSASRPPPALVSDADTGPSHVDDRSSAIIRTS